MVNVFAREGEYWTVVFDGRVSRLRDAKGLHYLDHLLRHPGQELHALALVAAVDAPPTDRPAWPERSGERSAGRVPAEGLSVAGPGDAGPVLDGTALAAYRRRFDELRDELAEAEAFADPDRGARAQEELDALTEQLTAGVGLGGRARRAGSPAERARLAVTKAIRAALRKLYEVDPAAANHLDAAVRTGTFCVYRPDPALDVTWRHKPTTDAPGTQPELVVADWRAARRRYVGRPVERRLAAELVAGAVAGRGGLVLVSGEAGIGKTRFTEEAAGEARARGMATLLGRCVEAEQAVPWLPLVEVLEQVAAHLSDEQLLGLLGDAGPEVAKVVPGLRRRLPDLPPPMELPAEQARHFLLTSLRDVVLRLAEERPLMVVIEDIHWADPATLTLLEHVVERLATARVLLLATYRSDEAEVGTPLARSVERLVRHPACSRVALRPLDEGEVAELLAELTGRQPPPGVASRLRSETDGNPFFLEELCKHLTDGGRLFGPDGEIRAGLAVEEADLPDTLRLTLGHRLQRLSAACRQVLALAAVIGRDVDVELVTATGARPDEDAVLDALDEAVDAGVLVAAPRGLDQGRDERLTFRHALLRQAVLAEVSVVRRQRLHLAVATALQGGSGESTERAAEIADHLSQVGPGADPALTASYLELAGRRALEAAAYEDAVARLRRALELGPPGDHQRRAALLADLGDAQRGLGWLDESLQSWAEALSVLGDHPRGDLPLVARVCRALGRSLDNTGRLDEAVAIVRRGLDIVGDGRSVERAQLLAALAYTLVLRGEHREAEARLGEAAAIAESVDDARVRADVLLTHNALLFTAGRLTECIETADAASAALLACGQAWEAPQPKVTVLWPCIWLGRLDEARRRAAESEPLAKSLGHVPAIFLTQRTRVLLDMMGRGDLERFRASAADGVAFCRAHHLRWLPDAQIFAGLAAFWLGDWDEAAEQLAAAASARVPPVYAGRYSSALLTLHAWSGAAAAFDRLRAEVRAALDALDVERSIGSLSLVLAEVEGLLLLGRTAEAATMAPAVTRILDDGLVLRPPDLRTVAALAGVTAGLAGDREASEVHFAEARRVVEALPYRREKPEVDFLHALTVIPTDGDLARRLLNEAVEGYRTLGMKRHADAAAERLSRA